MYTMTMSELNNNEKVRQESKEIFSRYIQEVIQQDNISETKVIEKFCETYGISYSTFIRWYKNNENINARSEAQINKALSESFVRCLCHNIENIDSHILAILTQPDSRVILETQWIGSNSVEELKTVFENQLTLLEKIEAAIITSRQIKKKDSAKNQLKIYASLSESCISIKNYFEKFKFNLYSAKVPYFKALEKEWSDLKDYQIYLLIIVSEAAPKDKIDFYPDLNKVQ